MNLLLNNLFYLNKFYKIEIVLSSNFACTVSKLTINMHVYTFEIFKYKTYFLVILYSYFYSYNLFISRILKPVAFAIIGSGTLSVFKLRAISSSRIAFPSLIPEARPFASPFNAPVK